MQFQESDPDAIPLFAVNAEDVEARLATLPPQEAAWLRANGFRGLAGDMVAMPDPEGGVRAAWAGLGNEGQRARGRFLLAEVAHRLPAATYRLETELSGPELDEAALALLLAGYRFDRYKEAKPLQAAFVAPHGLDATRLEAIASGEALTRDLINTPANDLSPAALTEAAMRLADAYGANVGLIAGEALLSHGFPLIHAVGRAAAEDPDRQPRLIDLSWGTSGPSLCLVGKGVFFDTGGLNLKPGASMGLMKKDMGGAATVLGLAQMIMALNMPLRLRVLIPAVENAVSGLAFRPGDILSSRKGLTVEINNTDAEGRLVLADALAYADEGRPDRIVSFATLTGAARVAVGPDIAPFYSTDEPLSEALIAAARGVADPVWRMPFHEPYEAMIEPGIADLDNAPSGGFAGSITAALFLRRFVEDSSYTHFDIYGWQPVGAPARPKGGVGQGARALLEALNAL